LLRFFLSFIRIVLLLFLRCFLELLCLKRREPGKHFDPGGGGWRPEREPDRPSRLRHLHICVQPGPVHRWERPVAAVRTFRGGDQRQGDKRLSNAEVQRLRFRDDDELRRRSDSRLLAQRFQAGRQSASSFVQKEQANPEQLVGTSRTQVWSSWLEDKLYAICNNFNILNLFIFHLKISFSVERNNYYTCMEKYFIAVVFKMFLSDAKVLSWCCILSFRYLFNDRNLHFNARLTHLGSGLF